MVDPAKNPGSEVPDDRWVPNGRRSGTRIFIADDHEVARLGLRTLLRCDGVVIVGESGSAREAQRRIPAFRPDVAIVARTLGDGSGIDVCRRVRAVDPGIRFIILDGAHDEDASQEAALAGAAGYLAKDASADELLEAIRRTADGLSPFGSGRRPTQQNSVRTASDPRLAQLNAQQQNVLELIGEGFTNREIADKLTLSEKTVKNYVSAILFALGLRHRTEAALFIRNARQIRNDDRRRRSG